MRAVLGNKVIDIFPCTTRHKVINRAKFVSCDKLETEAELNQSSHRHVHHVGHAKSEQEVNQSSHHVHHVGHTKSEQEEVFLSFFVAV
jgi:hypothetical protein